MDDLSADVGECRKLANWTELWLSGARLAASRRGGRTTIRAQEARAWRASLQGDRMVS
jgi:hypothetical protein